MRKLALGKFRQPAPQTGGNGDWLRKRADTKVTLELTGDRDLNRSGSHKTPEMSMGRRKQTNKKINTKQKHANKMKNL